MIELDYIKKYTDYVSSSTEKYYKTTLFENEKIMVGLNCFGPGQEMFRHPHSEKNRFYLILEGQGLFQLDDASSTLSKDQLFFVPDGHSHRITNTGTERLVVLVGIAPPHAD